MYGHQVDHDVKRKQDMAQVFGLLLLAHELQGTETWRTGERGYPLLE